MEWFCSRVRRKMIEMMIMLGGKGGELFPLTKAVFQPNIISDYPQYGKAANIAVSSDGTVMAMHNGSVVKIFRFVSGTWNLESTTATTYPTVEYSNPTFSFSDDGSKLFIQTSGEVLAFERSGSVWTKSTVVVGGITGIKSTYNGVAVFLEDYDSVSTVRIYSKPVSSWVLQQTINVPRDPSSAAGVSFNVSTNGQYIVTHNAAASSTKTYPVYKWNGSTFASYGTVTVNTPGGGAGAYSKYDVSDDGITFVSVRDSLTGLQDTMVAKYSGGSWSQVTSPGFAIPRSESYRVSLSSDGKFVATLGSSSTFVYRLSPSGIFISKHTLVPTAYSSYLIGAPVFNSLGSEIYTPLSVYSTGPIGLLTNKR